MFINGSHLCSNDHIKDLPLCKEHQVKIIKTDTCNICLSEMNNDYVFIHCGHSFHKDCIGEWLIKKRTCPCCRKSVSSRMSSDEINNHLNQLTLDVSEFGNIRLTRDFIDWIFEMSRIYIEDVTDISLLDVLYIVQLPINFEYYFTVYSNERNNISINLFELELKLNQIANNIRNYNSIYLDYLENDLEEDLNNSGYENSDYEHSDYENNDHINNNEMININELEFSEF